MLTKIDSKYYVVGNRKSTIMQACMDIGIDIPCFCFHNSLSIAGNCRMCLVEVKTSKNLVASCAMQVVPNMEIWTNSERVQKARESVIEFLLINHPLDCPVCDQGGECDLQEITKTYGSDSSRFYEYKKRSVINKEVGPFIKMVMTRCIHCTRCVRFFQQISEDFKFGVLGRGGSTEIGTYVSSEMLDPMSGNVVDLCPVGALTSKPYSFKSRNWELISYESVSIVDYMLSNVRIDVLNNVIMRVLPIIKLNIQDEWITNITRYFYDSTYYQRLNNIYILLGGKISKTSWLYILKSIYLDLQKNIFNYSAIHIDTTDYLDLKTYKNLQLLKKSYNFKIVNKVNLQKFKNFNISNLKNFSSRVEQTKFVVVLLNYNMRLEAPLINVYLKRYVKFKDKKYTLLNFGNFFFKSGINKSIQLNNLNNLSYSKFGNSLGLLQKNVYKFFSKYLNLVGFSSVFEFGFTNLIKETYYFLNNLGLVYQVKFLDYEKIYKYKMEHKYILDINLNKQKVEYSKISKLDNLKIFMGSHLASNNLLEYKYMLPVKYFYEFDGEYLDSFSNKIINMGKVITGSKDALDLNLALKLMLVILKNIVNALYSMYLYQYKLNTVNIVRNYKLIIKEFVGLKNNHLVDLQLKNPLLNDSKFLLSSTINNNKYVYNYYDNFEFINSSNILAKGRRSTLLNKLITIIN